MVIFICGAVGAGKSSLGAALAERLHADYCEADRIKERFIDPSLRGRAHTPLTDEARMSVAFAIAADMRERAARGGNLVLDDTLHRRAARDVLFRAAEEYFGGYVVVRVHADEALVRERLGSSRDGHLLGDNLEAMRAAISAQQEDFDTPVIEFQNDAPFEESCDRLETLVRPLLRR